MSESAAIGDRTRNQAALASVATWLAFMAALLIGGELQRPLSFAVAAALGAALVLLGFSAASRCRPISWNSNTERLRLTLLALAVGVSFGLANLAANWAIAQADPRLRTLMFERFAAIEPIVAVVVAPIREEVVLRLFLMSVIAYVASRLTSRAAVVFAIALVGSAVVFGLLHLGRPMPPDASLANYYRAALVAKYTLAAVPLGWIFWRWGLPYAILCHAAANATHLALQSGLF